MSDRVEETVRWLVEEFCRATGWSAWTRTTAELAIIRRAVLAGLELAAKVAEQEGWPDGGGPEIANAIRALAGKE